MNLSRRTFLASAAGLLLPWNAEVPGLADAASSPSVSFGAARLRGYGGIAATHRTLLGGAGSATHVVCESHEKALLLQAKYLGDLTRLPVAEARAQGRIACFARGRDVLILAAEGPAQLSKLRAALLPQDARPAELTARADVPMYLDRWDKYGLLIYYAPFTAPASVPWPEDAYDYGSDVAFVKENGTGLVIWDKPCQWDTAEGMPATPWWGWVQEEAARQGVPMHLNTADDWPVLWLSNRYRDETQLRMPQFLGGFYDVGGGSGASGALSYFSEAGRDALLGTLQDTVKEFAPDANIAGWMEPHGETSQLPQSLMCEYGPVADQSFRMWLRERYGTLAVVSERWHGDPGHLHAWEDVHAPEIAEFAGFGPDAIDLQGTWRVKYVIGADGKPSPDVPPEWNAPAFDDSGWDSFFAPGNDRMMTMPRNPLVYRRTVDVPAEWLANTPQVTLYVWTMLGNENEAPSAWVNGVQVQGTIRRGMTFFPWAALDVSKLLKLGSNVIVLHAPRAAICYRVYLSQTPPAQYPDLGQHLNARWADYNNWTLAGRKDALRRGLEMVRQVDAGRSINMMAPGDDIGPEAALCRAYGARFHDTGAMAGFWTDQNALMMSGAHLPNSAEPGGPAPNVAEFQKYWGRWITEGVNGVHYFLHLGDILWNPPVLAEFEKNRVLYESIGKYHAPFAELGILFSTRCYRLTQFPWDPDQTDRWPKAGYYSGANPSGAFLDTRPRDGISEEDLGAELAARLRVVLDADTSFFDDAVLAGIETYVRAGGVFITRAWTGRHTETEPDTWPISRLSGYRVVNADYHGSVSPAPGQNAEGASAWAQFSSAGLSLEKILPECRDLLHWNDGTVAVGVRPLGRGFVVHVGPRDNVEPLWEHLADSFGATARVPAHVTPAPGLHFRHFIANTGLADVWVVFNESDAPVTTSLTFLPGVHPEALTELVSDAALPLTRDAAGDHADGIALAPHQTRLWLSPKADVTGSPWEWLNLQRGWWQGTQAPSPRHLPTPAEQQRFALDVTHEWAFLRADHLTDAQAEALAQPGASDHGWSRQNIGVWLLPNDHQPKRIVLRRHFTVPAHWTPGRVFLNTGDAKRSTRVFLDGKPLLDGRSLWDGDNMDAVGGALVPGSTHVLAFDVTGNGPPLGITGPCWLTFLPNSPARQDLSGSWDSFTDALHAAGPVTIPGTASNVAFLSREVTIDAAHTGRNVVLYTEIGIDAIHVNGRRLVHQGRTSDHTVVWFNITPLLRFDAPNILELSFRPGNPHIPLGVVELRFYEKGTFP